jgi:hypothetical protein
MSKNEIKAIIRAKFVNLSQTEALIMEEFAEAVEHRLSQSPSEFTEIQCLKSWEQYKSGRLPVYNALEKRNTPPKRV